MYVFINSHGYSRNTQSIVSKRYLLKISITLEKKNAYPIHYYLLGQSTSGVNGSNQILKKKIYNKQQNKTYFNKQKRLLLFSSFHTDTYPVFWPVTLGTGTLWV